MIILPLTPAQAKAFDKLKAAYKACEKSGIYFVNNYGSLLAFDKAIVKEYADSGRFDESDDDVVSNHEAQPSHEMKIAQEWCDDEHLIKLTAKGKKLVQKKDDDDE